MIKINKMKMFANKCFNLNLTIVNDIECNSVVQQN